MRMYQIQENPRGAVLSVVPWKIPMVVKGDGLQCYTGKVVVLAVYCGLELIELQIDETEGQDAGGR